MLRAKRRHPYRPRASASNPIAEITDSAAMIQLQSGFGEWFCDAASVRYDHYDTFGGKATFRIVPALLLIRFPVTRQHA
jgi:outer membrane cobalamin receptor